MLNREEKVGHIKGVAVSRGAPRISHLLFADDSIVFCRATVEECGRVIKVLEDYERDFGQKLNKEKPLFSLVRIPIGRSRNKLRRSLEHKLFNTMKSIWVYLHWWGEVRERPLIASKT